MRREREVSHRRSASTSDAAFDPLPLASTLAAVATASSIPSTTSPRGTPMGLPVGLTTSPPRGDGFDLGDEETGLLKRTRSGMVMSFLKTGGTKVLEKGNKVLEKGLEKRNKLLGKSGSKGSGIRLRSNLSVNIPGGGHNASCNDAMSDSTSPTSGSTPTFGRQRKPSFDGPPLPPPRSVSQLKEFSPTEPSSPTGGHSSPSRPRSASSSYIPLRVYTPNASSSDSDADSVSKIEGEIPLLTLMNYYNKQSETDENEEGYAPSLSSSDGVVLYSSPDSPNRGLELSSSPPTPYRGTPARPTLKPSGLSQSAKSLTSKTSRAAIPPALSDHLVERRISGVDEPLGRNPSPRTKDGSTAASGARACKDQAAPTKVSKALLMKESFGSLEDWILNRPVALQAITAVINIMLLFQPPWMGIMVLLLGNLVLMQGIWWGLAEFMDSHYCFPVTVSICLGVVVYTLCTYALSRSRKEPSTPSTPLPATSAFKQASPSRPATSKPEDLTQKRIERIDAKKCYAVGRGVEENAGKVGESIEFMIHAMTVSGKKFTSSIEEYFKLYPEEADSGGFRVDVEGKANLIPTIQDNGDGTILVTYTPRKTGAYELMITFGGRPIQRVPILVNITSGDIDASQCIARGSGLGGLPAVLGERLEIRIETFDSQGHPRSVGGSKDGFGLRLYEQGGVGTVTAFGAIKERDKERERELLVDTHVVDAGDGSYTLSYAPLRLGLFRLVLTFQGNIVTESCLFVVQDKRLQKVTENVKKKRAIFKATLLDCVDRNGVRPQDEEPSQSGTAKVQVLLTPQQLAINSSFVLGLFSRRLATWKISPSLRIALDMATEREFCLEHKFRSYRLSCKERDVLFATLKRMASEKIGRSNLFEDKRNFFFEEMRKLHAKSKVSSGPTPIQVDRRNVLKDAYSKMKDFGNSQWRGAFYTNFIGESGVDTGGITKELFTILGREIFHPNNNLFRRFSEDSPAVHPAPFVSSFSISPSGSDFPQLEGKSSPPSSPTGASLDIFKFAGKFLAKCLYDSAVREPRLINVSLTKAFYKLILHLPVDFGDFEIDDSQYYNSKVKYILENNVDEAELCLKFVEEEYEKDGKVKRSEELRPNGRNIDVTEENKVEYLQLLSYYRLYSSVRKEVDSFREGFYSLIPEDLISMFDEHELELLVCGLPNISVEDMKAHTAYSGGLSPESLVVIWFWSTVENFTQAELARLLQFVTGSSQIPVDGFKLLTPTFTIARSFASRGSLPHAHTCLNQIDLPDYKSCEQLQERLTFAITNFSEGFGFA